MAMARGDRWRVLLVAATVLGLAQRCEAAGVDCAVAKPGELLAAAIGVEADASVPAGVLEAALGAWRGCPTAGTGFPEFTAAARERSVIRVRYVAGNSRETRCGFFSGSEIVLFASAVDRLGRAVPCGSPAANLAHELGHALGLGDAPADPRCRQYIMSADDPRPGRQRSVQSQECAAADAHWLTPSEGAVLAHGWRRVEGEQNLWLALEPALAEGPDPLPAAPARRSEWAAPSAAPTSEVAPWLLPETQR
jgi:hypothetical protein